MVRIGPVNDDLEHLKLMRELLRWYKRRKKIGFSIEEYRDGLSSVEDYDGTLDTAFLDIEMPHIGGMTAAEKIREGDQILGVVLVTNMVQLAIHGYRVDTIDFIVKLVGYYVFADKSEKAIRFFCTKVGKESVAQTEEPIVKLTSSQLLYIKEDKGYLVYHTLKGELHVRGTLVTLEESLEGKGSSKCISGCLINLRYIIKISKDMVWVGQTPPPISRYRNREFKGDLMRYPGGDY